MTSSVLKSVHLLHNLDYVSRIDPRARIVVAVVFSLMAAEVRGFGSLGIALAASMFVALFSGLSAATLFRRLMPLNALMLLLAVLLPLTISGKSPAAIGTLNYSQEGFLLVAKIAIKGNAIVLAVIVLIGTMDVNTLGHALSHLYVPKSLSHLLLFTVRYLDVLHEEYVCLRWAMKVRGFRPRMDPHTYRAFGNLLGMLLVRGYDRSERILAAMKCRGFQGQFYLLDHFHYHSRDLFFYLASAVVFLAMLAVEIL
jgi:cobalt/nickel transport system permease protein